MSKTHVVHMSTVHNPYDTRILYRECTSLANNGYDVTLFTCSEKPVEAPGVQIITFPLPKSRMSRMTGTAFNFIRQAYKCHADIYHFHDPELAPWMLLLRLVGKKVVFDVHENILGSISDRSWIPKPLQPLIFNVAKILLPLIMKPFSVVFAERSYPKAYTWVKNYEVVCNFPNIDFFPAEIENTKFEKFSIVYVGSITEPRGIIDTLDALSILQERGLHIDFYLIGKSHLSGDKDLNKLISERNLKHVKVLGYTPQPEALKIVAKCHLGLAVLHPVQNYLLSYPTKIFEYMGCKTAFITSNFPLYQDVVNKWKCGATIPPQDPLALADKIEFYNNNTSLLIEMAERGREAVESEFNWSIEEKNLLKLYDKILKSK